MAAGQWPFQSICDQMCTDVLDPVWEVAASLLWSLKSHFAFSSLASLTCKYTYQHSWMNAVKPL